MPAVVRVAPLPLARCDSVGRLQRSGDSLGRRGNQFLKDRDAQRRRRPPPRPAKPGWAMSPSVVTPQRMLSSQAECDWPARELASGPPVADNPSRRRSQSTKPMPGSPSGTARSLKSRCVWALTSPGRMATLPRSRTSPCAATGCPPRRCVRPSIVTAAVGNRLAGDGKDVAGAEDTRTGCALFATLILQGARLSTTSLSRATNSNRRHRLRHKRHVVVLAALDGLFQFFFRRFRSE